jgi:hypothetical protein
MRDLSKYPDRKYMSEIEKALNRDRSTIRTWEIRGWLPDELQFHRDDAGWRYWTEEQLEAAKEWLQQPRRRAPRRRDSTTVA